MLEFASVLAGSEEAIEREVAKALLKLHNPPRGAHVERDRLKFYFERAAQTRKEAIPTRQAHIELTAIYATMFSQRSTPFQVKADKIFDPDGNVKMPVFEAARASLKSDSSPGFPFQHYAQNCQVPAGDLYSEFNHYMQMLRDTKALAYTDPSQRGTANARFLLMKYGGSYPALVHVKSEPTSESKVARLIFATSCVVQMASRVLYPSLMTDCTSSWEHATHKVGLDFQTDQGLEKFKGYLRALRMMATRLGLELVADDIQGWEFMFQTFMEFDWVMANILFNKDDRLIERMKMNLHFSEANALVALSDGELVLLPHFIMMSGRLFTHVLNSDARAALAIGDYNLDARKLTFREPGHGREVTPPMGMETIRRMFAVCTNGDDCISARPPGMAPKYSVGMGMVHTDFVIQKGGVFNFCSQIFTDDKTLQRCPEKLEKLIYNFVTATSIEARLAIAMEMNLRPDGAKILAKLSGRVVSL